ncbi:hypothetical protein, partial [Enterobacter intestinihominis]
IDFFFFVWVGVFFFKDIMRICFKGCVLGNNLLVWFFGVYKDEVIFFVKLIVGKGVGGLLYLLLFFVPHPIAHPHRAGDWFPPPPGGTGPG